MMIVEIKGQMVEVSVSEPGTMIVTAIDAMHGHLIEVFVDVEGWNFCFMSDTEMAFHELFENSDELEEIVRTFVIRYMSRWN